MLRLPRASITFSDKVHPAIKDVGLAIATGDTPGGTVKISLPDMDKKKYVQVDRLTQASWTRKGDTWTFKGTSQHLVETVGAQGDDAYLEVTVKPAPGCEDCQR